MNRFEWWIESRHIYLFKNGRRRIRGVVCSDKSDGRIYWILLMAREEMTLRTIQCCRDSCRFLQNGDGLVDWFVHHQFDWTWTLNIIQNRILLVKNDIQYGIGFVDRAFTSKKNTWHSAPKKSKLSHSHLIHKNNIVRHTSLYRALLRNPARRDVLFLVATAVAELDDTILHGMFFSEIKTAFCLLLLTNSVQDLAINVDGT